MSARLALGPLIAALTFGTVVPAQATTSCEPIVGSRIVGAGCSLQPGPAASSAGNGLLDHNNNTDANNTADDDKNNNPSPGGGNGAPSDCHMVYGFTFDPADPNADITANGSG